MSVIKIIGVSRGNEYSPNHIGNDAAIFSAVVENLKKHDCLVETYTEKEFVSSPIEADVIFNMARDRATMMRLKEFENNGALVINSAFGIDNCVRKPMTEILIQNSIPHPASSIVFTNDDICSTLSYPCWIKRGDSHALVKEDVCYAEDEKQAEDIFEDFRNRNIPNAVINEHLYGDLVKFYGVREVGFFYWFYPSPCSHSKFGLEKINGEAQGIPFSEQQLKKYCEKASNALNVPVYGGDCVISSTGEMHIIDFNDWPSFARCREEAGESIAAYIYKQATSRLMQEVEK